MLAYIGYIISWRCILARIRVLDIPPPFMFM
jgi:hypothetical protein